MIDLIVILVPLAMAFAFGAGVAAGRYRQRQVLVRGYVAVLPVLRATRRLVDVEPLGQPQESALRREEARIALFDYESEMRELV